MNPYDIDAHSDNQSAQVIQIDNSRLLPWFVMALAISLVSLVACLLVYKDLWDKFTMTENEAKMLEMYVMETDAKLVANGVIRQDETWLGVRPKLFNKVPERK